jgi:glutaredoxin 3
LLYDNNLQFQEFDVSKDKAAREEMVNKTEQIKVPVIEIDSELAVGYDEEWIKNKLGLTK